MAHHCHDEHEGHGHGDENDHGVHDHSDDMTPALQYSLYQHIVFDQVQTLNEEVEGSGRAILKKPWTERLDTETVLESSADEQILIEIPFTGQIKLHSILLRTSSSSHAPRTLKIFLNKTDLDFSDATDLPATQTIELSQTGEIQEVPVRRALFARTRSLTLFFEDNFSYGEEDVTELFYLAFKGGVDGPGSRPPLILHMRRLRTPADHKVMGKDGRRVGEDLGGR